VATRRGTVGWVLAVDDAPSALGRALVWSRRHQLSELHLLVDDPGEAGVLARRAGAFAVPPRVWSVEGRTARPAVPAPSPGPVEPPAVARGLAAALAEAGTEVVTEHGQIRGEVLGLEVARVVVDEDAAGAAVAARIEVGVGRHDRDAFAMLHGAMPTPAALATVIDKVRTHRRHDAEAHPLGRLAAERWLRVRILEHPELVGASRLSPADPTVPRDGVKDVAPAIAVGHDERGGAVVVACSVGIDPDLVPAAADARLTHAPDGRLVLVVPERDAHRVTRDLAAALAVPAELVVVPGDWRRLDPGSAAADAAP
jgi:hypothetical protein